MQTRLSAYARRSGQTYVRSFFFFNDTATTEIYTLSLHDALPISARCFAVAPRTRRGCRPTSSWRSEEHTSELQSRVDLVCRLLLDKKKNYLAVLSNCEKYYIRSIKLPIVFCL